MPKFRKKPVVIAAIQWTGSWSMIAEWLESLQPSRMAFQPGHTPPILRDGDQLLIETLEGLHVASLGDWIIQGVRGELYPCKPDIFEQTYEPVEETDGE